MSTYDLYLGVPLLLVPFFLGGAWWRWSRRDRSRLPVWRQQAILFGLLAASIHFVLFYGWVAYGFTTPRTDSFWAAKHALANYALPLSAVTLVAAAVGRSRGRVLVAIAAVLQAMLWIEFGFL